MGKKDRYTLERFVIVVAIVHVLCNGQQTKGGLAPSSSRFRIARCRDISPAQRTMSITQNTYGEQAISRKYLFKVFNWVIATPCPLHGQRRRRLGGDACLEHFPCWPIRDLLAPAPSAAPAACFASALSPPTRTPTGQWSHVVRPWSVRPSDGAPVTARPCPPPGRPPRRGQRASQLCISLP